MALRRLLKELRDITENPSEHFTASPVGDNLFEWNATIKGPSDSPYAGGTFHLTMEFPHDYPFNPPNIKFVTKIYHCIFSSEGSIPGYLLPTVVWIGLIIN